MLSRWLWLDLEGSTRLAGLLRIALALLLWATWATPFIVHFDMQPVRVGLGLLFYLCSALLFVGLWTSLAAPVMAGTLVAASLLLGQGDPASLWLTQERQLATLLAVLVALSPAGRSLSLDRLLALRRAEAAGLPAPAERGPLWSLRLAQLAGSLLLLVTALGRLDPAWLGGVALAATGDLARPLSLALLGLPLLGLPALWWPRSRVPAALVLGALYLLHYPWLFVGTSCLSICWLLATFLPPDAVHRALDRLHGVEA